MCSDVSGAVALRMRACDSLHETARTHAKLRVIVFLRLVIGPVRKNVSTWQHKNVNISAYKCFRGFAMKGAHYE
jgi:hypothetical protein